MILTPEREKELRQLAAHDYTAKALTTELFGEIERLRGAMEVARKSLEWEEHRCGRLHGPLAIALTTIRKLERESNGQLA